MRSVGFEIRSSRVQILAFLGPFIWELNSKCNPYLMISSYPIITHVINWFVFQHGSCFQLCTVPCPKPGLIHRLTEWCFLWSKRSTPSPKPPRLDLNQVLMQEARSWTWEINNLFGSYLGFKIVLYLWAFRGKQI